MDRIHTRADPLTPTLSPGYGEEGVIHPSTEVLTFEMTLYGAFKT
jgi:hypothetical protein